MKNFTKKQLLVIILCGFIFTLLSLNYIQYEDVICNVCEEKIIKDLPNAGFPLIIVSDRFDISAVYGLGIEDSINYLFFILDWIFYTGLIFLLTMIIKYTIPLIKRLKKN